jgi:AraC-like DNA-binding protein/mannose-6-phosphate isomerase-like protein (cupin superfamily)
MPPDVWAPADPLGEALHFLRMSGVVYTRSELTAPWGVDLPAMPDCVMFHVVTSGTCWLEVEDGEPVPLRPGEFTLVPHGEGHRISDAPGSPTAYLFDIPREQVSPRYEILRHGGGGEPTKLVCGAVRFDHPAAQELVRLLPKVIRVEAWSSPESEWMQSTLRLMASESGERRAGGEAVVTRLADILVIQAIRSWIAANPAAQTGWLGALHDERIGPAILQIQREPEREWSVASLAKEVAMSRSAFAARFRTLVGETPMEYVTRWRMHVATTLLQEEGATVAELAGRLGYRSEAAFSRAFKRVIGASPGAVRRGGGSDPPPSTSSSAPTDGIPRRDPEEAG